MEFCNDFVTIYRYGFIIDSKEGFKNEILSEIVVQNPCCDYSAEQKVAEKKEPEKKALVFDKAIDKVTEELKDKQNFPYTKDVHFEVNNEKKEVVMTAIMNNGLKKWVAMEFADTMIRRFSFWAAFYNNTLKGPDKDSYGSLFDEYGIFIVVGSSADGKNNYYEKFIRPKMHTKQGPDWKEAQRKGE